MPTPPAETQVTQLLHAARGGDPRAAEQLLPLVYDELKRLARSYMRKESPGQTLQATALVHDAYLRLVGPSEVSWESRGHFFGAAALAMRRILVERARARAQVKRGSGRERVELTDVAEVATEEGEEGGTDLVSLDAALIKLASVDKRKHDVVMLRYFAGLTNDEAAAALGVSPATVRNDWTYSKVWLIRELRGGAGS